MKLVHAYEQFASTTGPTVMVRENVLETYGTPEINHDGLEQLFTDEFQLPAKDFTVKFHAGNALGYADAPLDFWRNGFRTPYTKTLHVPVHHNGWDRTPMQRLINLGLLTSEKQHLSPPLRLLPTEIVLGASAVLATGIEVDSPVLAMIGTAGISMVGIAKASCTNPSQRVDSGRVHELRKVHDSDVNFPKLMRGGDEHYLDRVTTRDNELADELEEYRARIEDGGEI